MLGRYSAGDLVSVEILRVQLEGRPACVHVADLRIELFDGSVHEVQISFEPDGLMYEVLEDYIAKVREWIRHEATDGPRPGDR